MTTNPLRAAQTRGIFLACAAFLAASVPVLAQTTAPDSATPPKGETLQLSKIEVNTTQDKGYVANNTATGFKTNQELIKIPQSITVVTRDLIDDIGATKTSDVLQFAGASQFYRGESIRLRGARTLNAYLDDAIENVPYSDNVDIDSYEVIRGPAGVLYANSSVGGVVLKATKKPLPYKMDKVTVSFNDWGQYRGELDSTGPVGEIADAKLSYRMVAAYQDGDSYFKNTEDQRLALHPTFQLDFKNTTVRFAVDYIDLTNIAGGQNFVLPNGQLYTGAGRDEGYYAKGIMENHTQVRERVAILQRISPNWESKTSLSHLKYERQGTNLLPAALDLSSNTFTLFARRNYQRLENWVLNQDFLGNYNIGPIANQTAAGFTLTDEYNRAAFTNSTTFGTNGRIGVNIANPQMDSIVVPTYESYAPVSTTGSWTNNRRSTYYIQQQATLIQDRLILVGGVSKAGLQINDVPAVAARNTAGGTRVVNYDETLHRYGAVVNVTKDIALFALDSTTFAPQGNSNTRDINGTLLPAQDGKGKEYGIKTALFNGKLSATISYFDMDLTNVAILQGNLSPVTGQAYFIASGLQKQKGWDGTIAWSPIPEWQIMVTGYKGTVKDQTGATVNNTYNSLYSFFTRYDFAKGSLKGFAIGGGASKTGGNIFTALGGYTQPVGSLQTSVTLESVWNASLFASYKYGPHWTFRLNVSNLLDKEFALGAQSVFAVDASPPRTFQLSATYKF
jgi:iron complex outermembrane recepter protein